MSGQYRRVVVTGMGAVTPIGNDIASYWQGLSSGVSGGAPITRFDAADYDTKFACEVKNFDVLQYVDRKLSQRMDLFTQFGEAHLQGHRLRSEADQVFQNAESAGRVSRLSSRRPRVPQPRPGGRGVTSLADLRAFIEANVTAIVGRSDWHDELALGTLVALPSLIVALVVMALYGRRRRT